MIPPTIRPEPSDRPGNSAGRTRASWRDRYPVLLACLTQGRNPGPADLERLASRIRRELDPRHPLQRRERPRGADLDVRALAVARHALEGDRSGGRPHRRSPLVLRGH